MKRAVLVVVGLAAMCAVSQASAQELPPDGCDYALCTFDGCCPPSCGYNPPWCGGGGGGGGGNGGGGNCYPACGQGYYPMCSDTFCDFLCALSEACIFDLIVTDWSGTPVECSERADSPLRTMTYYNTHCVGMW